MNTDGLTELTNAEAEATDGGILIVLAIYAMYLIGQLHDEAEYYDTAARYGGGCPG